MSGRCPLVVLPGLSTTWLLLFVVGVAQTARSVRGVEPVFGQVKFNRGFDRFKRRERAAVRSEWQLAAASHNLLKLHNHRIAGA